MTKEKARANHKRFCRCGCGILIDSYNKWGYEREYVNHHGCRGKKNPRSSTSGIKHWNWRGGKYVDGYGYIRIYIPTHPYKDKHGYVREHRLVMEQHIGRYLKPDEEVHHINGNKQDNRIDNLELLSITEHRKKHNKIKLINNR